MNIRSTLTGSVADFERCAGKLDIVAKEEIENIGDPDLAKYLKGAANGIRALLTMEYGDNEENLVTKVINSYE